MRVDQQTFACAAWSVYSTCPEQQSLHRKCWLPIFSYRFLKEKIPFNQPILHALHQSIPRYIIAGNIYVVTACQLRDNMDDARASSSKLVGSAVCNVCKGLLNLENPRGFVLERPPHDSYHAIRRYVHTYMHHANTAVLLASAAAGCRMCTVICDVLRRKSPRGLDAVDADSSLNLKFSQSTSITPALISDEDVLTATQLAVLAKRKRLFKRVDLRVHDDRRIFVQSNSNEKFGLLRSSEAIGFMCFYLYKRSCPLTSLKISGTSRHQLQVMSFFGKSLIQYRRSG